MARRRSNSLFTSRKPSAQATTDRAPKFVPGTHHLSLDEFFSLLSEDTSWTYAQSASMDFCGWMTYHEAKDAAILGKWDAPQIKNLVLPEMTQASEEMRYWNDVTGNQLDVASFCAGEPEYWQNSEPIQKPCGRVLRFAIEIGGMSSVTAEEMRNRGEAIVCLINSLELQGHSVEVMLVRSFQNLDNGRNYNFLIPIKNAGMGIDVKRFQFIIGHPAFYRRLLFALSEIAQGANLVRDGCTRTTEYAPDGFIHIGHKQGLGSQEFAMQWAQEFALTFANQEQN